ncbi:MAG TPA: hypothetical protein VNP92_01350 [Actinophytocola sp.]|nr:hypothetical protein [Actinophytocola sp.]
MQLPPRRNCQQPWFNPSMPPGLVSAVVELSPFLAVPLAAVCVRIRFLWRVYKKGDRDDLDVAAAALRGNRLSLPPNGREPRSPSE